MNTSAASTVAALIWRHRQSGQAMPALDTAQRPTDRRQGYAAQAALAVLNQQAVAGWKIAATRAAGQQHIGVSGPLAGRIFALTVIPQNQAVSLDAYSTPNWTAIPRQPGHLLERGAWPVAD